MSLLANSNAIETGGYLIQSSLRFRSSASAYLNRTFGSGGNSYTYSFSGWVKRGALGAQQGIFGVGTATAGDTTWFGFTSTDNFILAFNDGTYYLQTTQVFRDPSAYYHVMFVVDTTQATASNRVKLYINGSQVTSFSTATYPLQNTGYQINGQLSHRIAARLRASTTDSYLDGYLAEVNFIDGQALTPSSFGQTDPVTGVWTPKKYTGTYGTNGFYLPFTDNSSPTTLGYDKSGNGNNWTANNISTTAGSTYDSMLDVPTLTSKDAANFAVMSPIDMFVNTSGVMTNGNLTFNSPTSAGVDSATTGTIGAYSGSWYFETTLTQGTSDTNAQIGILQNHTNSGFGSYSCALNFYTYGSASQTFKNGTAFQTGLTACTAGDVIGIAYDATNGTMQFYRNGSAFGNQVTGLTTGTYVPFVYAQTSGTGTRWILNVNFGQRPFSYTPPTGFKALNTFNLPDPTIKKPNQYMDATTYTGTGTTTNNITTLGFQPDFVWIKDRQTAYDHHLFDSVRGAANSLNSNATNAENYYSTSLASFNSNGFTITNTGNNQYYLNKSGDAFVSWNWKKGATPGFDIVTYTGTGANQNISHSLGVAPKMMIVKARSAGGYSWGVYHVSTGAGGAMWLNATDAYAASSNRWNNTAPTSSVFTVGTDTNLNNNGTTYVAYLFAEIAGFSKFGSYTGNGSADGPFVYCGFRPKYVLIKRTDASQNWPMIDTARSPINVGDQWLFANLSDAEYAGTLGAYIDILSNGFKLRIAGGAGFNTSSGTYIFAAFAENPFKYANAR